MRQLKETGWMHNRLRMLVAKLAKASGYPMPMIDIPKSRERVLAAFKSIKLCTTIKDLNGLFGCF